MIIFKDWFISFVAVGLLAFSGFALSGQSQITFSVKPQRIQPGEHAVLEIIFSPKSVLKDAAPVLHDELLQKSETIQWLDRSSKQDGDKTIWRFEFTSYAVGKTVVPPVEVDYAGDSFSTETSPVEISTTRQDGDENLREEYGPVPLPIQWRHLAQMIGLGLLFGIAALLIIFLGRKFWPKKGFREEEDDLFEEDPLIWLRARLNTLKNRLHQPESSPERPLDELTGLLRTYFAKASRNPVEAWTTGEFRQRFKRDETAQLVAGLLEHCDELKFGGSSEDLNQAARRAAASAEKILFP